MPNRESAPPEPATHERALRTLSPAECLDLLEPGGIGRVGFTSADGIMMLPVNFAVTGKTIIFRTAPDTLLALYADAQVSFEVDRFDEALHEGWSVLVQGHAHKVTDEREVKHLDEERTSSRGHPAAASARAHRADPDQRATHPAKLGQREVGHGEYCWRGRFLRIGCGRAATRTSLLPLVL